MTDINERMVDEWVESTTARERIKRDTRGDNHLFESKRHCRPRSRERTDYQKVPQ